MQRHPLARVAGDAWRRARLFTEPRTPGRVIIALAAIPIAIVANATRVAGTGFASHWAGPAAAEGFFHTFSGWIMFVIALAGLLIVQRVVSRIHFPAWRPRAVSAEA